MGLAYGDSHSTDPFGLNCLGRFKLSEIANMDQTPISFEFLNKRTYKKKGAKTVWLKETQSGCDRRQATLQICVFADCVASCKPQLIFKGKEQGQKAWDKERKSYRKGVDVVFNKKAWENEQTMLHWIKRRYRPASG